MSLIFCDVYALSIFHYNEADEHEQIGMCERARVCLCIIKYVDMKNTFKIVSDV